MINLEKVYQTNTTPGEGNCLSACLATLMGLRITDVPNFRKESENPVHMMQLVQEWLNDFDMYLLTIRVSLDEIVHYPVPQLEDDYALCIAGGKSPNFEGVSHSVVGYMKDVAFHLYHDPNPASNGFKSYDDITTISFLVNYNIGDRFNGV